MQNSGATRLTKPTRMASAACRLDSGIIGADQATSSIQAAQSLQVVKLPGVYAIANSDGFPQQKKRISVDRQ
jgi:hypothetical protein